MLNCVLGFIATIGVGILAFGFCISFCTSGLAAFLLEEPTESLFPRKIESWSRFKTIFLITHFFIYGPILWLSIKNGYIIPFESSTWPELSVPSVRTVTIGLFMICALFTIPVWWLLYTDNRSI
jgi:hypothetical protein